MGNIAEILTNINKALGPASALLGPGGAIMGFVTAVANFIQSRRDAGEPALELEAQLDMLDRAIQRAKESNDRYWELPVKPEQPIVEPELPVPTPHEGE